MRDPRNALRPFVIKATREACDKAALELFDLHKLADSILSAAIRGEGALKIPLGPLALDLRGTDAAKALVAWVQDSGMKLEWAERHVERPNGLKVKVAEPVISWTDEAYTLG